MTTDTETNGKIADAADLPEPASDANNAPEESMSQDSQALVLSQQNPVVLKEPARKLPNNRPITASQITIVDTMNIMGARPISANTFTVAHNDTLPGHRPVATSALMKADTSRLPGHRPIASNEIDDPLSLMGFLD